MEEEQSVGSGISRRDVIKSLVLGAAGGSVLFSIPAEAAQHVHELVRTEKASASGHYTPKYFSPASFALLKSLCEAILPSDAAAPGAAAAGAPEFIDLLCSENEEYALKLGGGQRWLEHYANDEFGADYLKCSPTQQKEILDLIAFRRNGVSHPAAQPGIAFFAVLRSLTCDAFYTSKIGIAYLGYVGNTYLMEFPGCPPLPDV
jgi:gluconate 2-dehydrogenase gamma chain